MPSMSSPPNALATDWLGACRRAVAGMREVLAEHPTSRERVIETGERGEGGDRTLVIDQQAEDAVFAQLDALHAEGLRFTAISEERGTVDYGGGDVLVVIDPLDGSLNAKRGIRSFSLSIAVADAHGRAAGPTMADVVFGYVYDFGPGEEWFARRGEGAFLNDVRIDAPPSERRLSDGRLEVLAIESADPRWIAPRIEQFSATVYRLRCFGSIAISMCQLAQTRVDGMLTLWRTRSVDVAAAQLIVRESGALVAFPRFDDPLGAPLDIEPRSPVVAARTAASLERLSAIVWPPTATPEG
jgi:myo-inositol-1(or 4)-monophosphatase